ncbi:MAG TPA: hypothetical protein VNZ94_09275 [Xanthobacteraceae bacterium]|nr:hypothetical protein [Xanthobacteraceae bacterium]
MSPLVLIAAAGVGGVMLARWGMREIQRINDELEKSRARVAERGRAHAVRQLRFDPETGTYRPVEHR